MEKVKVNNQVVLMRKYVKQAKVHAINNLVKQVKLLQNRKGNEAQVQKAKRKAERYLEEVNLLKKMKPDYVSKLALSKAKDWKDVIQQKTSSMEDRCLAKLANYEAVQKEVGTFHSSNPHLVSKIQDLINEWEEKNKFPKSPDDKKNILGKNKTGKKFLKVLTGSNKEALTMNENKLKLVEKSSIVPGNCNLGSDSEIIEKNMHVEGTKSEVKERKNSQSKEMEHKLDFVELKKDISLIKKPEVVEDDEFQESCSDGDMVNSDMDEDDKEESSNIDENQSEIEGSDNTDADINTTPNDKDKHSNIKISVPCDDRSIVKLNKKRKLADNQNLCVDEIRTLYDVKSDNIQSNSAVNRPIISTENRLKTITMLNLDDLEGLDEIPVNKGTEDEDSDEDNEKRSIKIRHDPFFLGYDELESTGEHKLISHSSNRKGLFTPKDDNDSKGENRFERRNGFKKDFKKSTNGSRFQKNESDKFNHERSFSRNKFQQKNQDRFQQRGRNQFQSKDQKDFNRKGKANFPDFRKQSYGEKLNKPHFRSDSNNSFTSRKDKIMDKKGDDASGKPLHPSWEAKRKQKELTQASFKGKRMVFD